MIDKEIGSDLNLVHYQFFKTSMKEKFVKEIQQTTNNNMNDLP